MIVLTIISSRHPFSVPVYRSVVLRAKEAVLKDNLYTLRSVINQYTADKKKAPQTLEDLVEAVYLHEIPKDPITESRETWELTFEDSPMLPDQTETDILDVHSGSPATSSEGTSYGEW